MVRAAFNFEHRNSDAKPYINIRSVKEDAWVEGQVRCSLGRRIPLLGQDWDEGVFVEWEWDGKRLTVENDRYGLYPLFFCAQGNSICISPSLAEVVKRTSDKELDYVALSVFFRMGHFIGEDTPFDEVRFMPPNSVLTWEKGRLNVRIRDPHITGSATTAMTFDESVSTYQALFARSISRRLPEDDRFTVPVSGGRDSRHILLELARQGVRPSSCLTVKYRPPATNEDTRIAKLLAERLGIEHIEIEKPASFFDAELNDVYLTNYCGGGHGWAQPVATALGGAFNTIYDGLGGSVLSGGFMLAEQKARLFREQSFETLARLILAENKAEEMLRNVFSDKFYRRIPLGEAVERLILELKKHADAPNPMLSFVFWNRTRRCVGSIPFAIFHQVSVVHVPYLDHEMFDFLFSLDASTVENNRLHDETIRRAYPEFADVPYENKNVRAGFQPGDESYYRNARRKFFSYLRNVPRGAGESIRRSYLFSKIAVDLTCRKTTPPWYMRTALQVIELDRLRAGY